MNYRDLLESITPEIYENLKRAVELGKWPDGRVVTPEQRQHCLEAVIAYEHQHLPPEERSGYIPPKTHTHCGGEGDIAEAEQPVKWK
ncbi:YeaC family protein [Marinimicrobium locisalis]|uniref:YeaC family protein n=1 Tax=Marinimicrobium locisalis TaxID=546022 RepID=UPI003221B60F